MVRPRHDEQAGVESPSGECHVHVVRVRVDGRDEAARAIDPGRPEDLVVGRVTHHHEMAVGLSAGERIGVDVDDDEALAGVVELARDGGAHPPVTGQDEMPAQAVHRLGHPLRLPSPADNVRQDRLGDDPHGPEDDRHPRDRHDERPQSTDVVEFLDLLETDRRQGDAGHVDRVADGPAEDQVPGRPDDDRGGHDGQPRSDMVTTECRQGVVLAPGRHRVDATSRCC